MWDLIVSVPDHCLSFYFLKPFSGRKCSQILHINELSFFSCVTLHHVLALQSTSTWFSDNICNGCMPLLSRMPYYYYRFSCTRLQVLSWSIIKIGTS